MQRTFTSKRVRPAGRTKKGPQERAFRHDPSSPSLSGAVTSGVEARDHGPTIAVGTRSALGTRRVKARLRRRPLVALIPVGRLLLLGLAVARVHVDIARRRTGSRPRTGPHRGAGGGLPVIGGRRRTVVWRRASRVGRAVTDGRRRVRHDVTVVRRTPGVINVIGVVVRNSAPPIRSIEPGQHWEKPRESPPVVRPRPVAPVPVAAAPVGAAAVEAVARSRSNVSVAGSIAATSVSAVKAG